MTCPINAASWIMVQQTGSQAGSFKPVQCINQTLGGCKFASANNNHNNARCA